MAEVDTARLKQGVLVMLGVVAGLWVIEAVNFVLLQSLNGLGIRAWNLAGLVGILFAPLLHADFAHLIANTVPLLVLGTMLWAGGKRDFVAATIASWIGSGLLAWLLSTPGTRIVGASGVVFGWTAFLIVRGILARTPGYLLVTLAVTLLYGTLLFGVFPGSVGVSWQGHLGGAIGGVLAAFSLYRNRPRQRA